jgi:hypothetical protein
MIGLTNDGLYQKGKLIKHDGAILDDGKRRSSKRSIKKSRRSRKSKRSSRKSKRNSRKSRPSKKHDGMIKIEAIKQARQFASKHKIPLKFTAFLASIVIAGYGLKTLWKHYSDYRENNFGENGPTALGFIDYLYRLLKVGIENGLEKIREEF